MLSEPTEFDIKMAIEFCITFIVFYTKMYLKLSIDAITFTYRHFMRSVKAQITKIFRRKNIFYRTDTFLHTQIFDIRFMTVRENTH